MSHDEPKSSPLMIGDRQIGGDAPVFVVAELSANHRQDLDVALQTVDAVAESGADAIKLQTYTPDTITFPGTSAVFRVDAGSSWDGRTLYDLYSEAYTPWEWHSALFARAKERGLVCFSSPFDPSAVDFLESLEVPAHKVASFEITDIPLIQCIAATGKPMIISTGIATLQEIGAAVDACLECGNDQIVLLKCTSAYPARLEEANLRTMTDMRSRFGFLVGLSDHTTSTVAAACATALGACLLEKHFTLDRGLGGPDSAFSLEPDEFARMVLLIRETEMSLGAVNYELTEGSLKSRQFARSLFVVQDVAQGDALSSTNVRSIRPSNGLSPSLLPSLLGRRFAHGVKAGSPLGLQMLIGGSE